MKIYKSTMKINRFTYFAFAVVIAFTSCDKRSTERGHSFLPDMQESQAYETYSENPNFEDSKTFVEIRMIFGK